MGWPQITLIVLSAMALGLHLAKDGEQRTDKYSFFGKLTASALLYGLLYAGGFFG